MPTTTTNYESFSTMLSQENIIVDAAEVQGILCGMLAGGMTADDQSWIEALSDVVNQGDGFSGKAKTQIVALFNEICQQYVDPEFALRTSKKGLRTSPRLREWTRK